MNETIRRAPVGDDMILPFAVPALETRGRVVQLGPALDRVIAGHGYPPAVARLLGEVAVLTVLLASSLKFDGKFILQTQTDGPVSLMVADYRSGGALRAYARFDAAKLADAVAAGHSPAQLRGRGTLAMTVDQGPNTSRYQGIVSLEEGPLEDAAHRYLMQSEQIPTRVRLSVAELLLPGTPSATWRAGGLLAQFLPARPRRVADLPGGDAPMAPVEPIEIEDAWLEAQALAASAADDELTDPAVGCERLLFRLFHERGVRVFNPQPVRAECSCSRQRVIGLLRGLNEADRGIDASTKTATVTCEFCSTAYEISAAEIDDGGRTGAGTPD